MIGDACGGKCTWEESAGHIRALTMASIEENIIFISKEIKDASKQTTKSGTAEAKEIMESMKREYILKIYHSKNKNPLTQLLHPFYK